MEVYRVLALGQSTQENPIESPNLGLLFRLPKFSEISII